METKYAIGTKYVDLRGRLHTVTDIHKTYNSAGELVKMRYVATHVFLGQTVTDSDVVQTTIDRSEKNVKIPTTTLGE